MNQVLPTMLLMTIASRSVRLYVATHAAVRRFVRFALCVDVVNIFLDRRPQFAATQAVNEEKARIIKRFTGLTFAPRTASLIVSLPMSAIAASVLLWLEWDGIATAWACVEVAPKLGRALHFCLGGLVTNRAALLLVAVPWIFSVVSPS